MNKFILLGGGVVIIVFVLLSKDTLVEYLSGKYTPPSSCEGQSNKDACYNSVAQKNKDPEICNKISLESGDPKSDSRDNCYSVIAEDLLKHQFCDRIKKNSGDGSRDTCYLNIATKTKNVVLCDQLTGQGVTEINGGKVYVNKDFCIHNVALEVLDPTVCDKISTKIHKQTSPLNVSVQSCYAFLGEKKKDSVFCNKAGELKQVCLDGVNQK